MSFLKSHHLCLGFFALQTLRNGNRWGRRKNQTTRKTTILFTSDNLETSATAILSWFILALNCTLDSKHPINLLSLCPFLPHGNLNDGKVHSQVRKKNLLIFIWSGRTIFFFDIADASFSAQAKFHKSNTMLSQEQERNVSAEAYCKSSWKGTLNSLGFLNT